MIDRHERLVWVTAAGDARDHAVLAATVAASSRASAEIVADCGAKFWPAPLVAEPGLPCPHCVGRLRRKDRRTVDPVRQREGVIGRWLTAVTDAAQHTPDVAVTDRSAEPTERDASEVAHR